MYTLWILWIGGKPLLNQTESLYKSLKTKKAVEKLRKKTLERVYQPHKYV